MSTPGIPAYTPEIQATNEHAPLPCPSQPWRKWVAPCLAALSLIAPGCDPGVSTPTTAPETSTTIPETADPPGRYEMPVFGEADIFTELVKFGSITNFSGTTEDLFMTINRPSGVVDSNKHRPLITAFPGGDQTGGFCGTTFEEEQGAMLELAEYGYATATIGQVVDSKFCNSGGAVAQDYFDNMAINVGVLTKAFNYLNSQAESLGVNPDRVAAYGYSIGAQTLLNFGRPMFSAEFKALKQNGFYIRKILAFAGVAPVEYDVPFGPIEPPDSDNNPDIRMISFKPDIGIQTLVNDASSDCRRLVTLGYDCIIGTLDHAGHSVHLLDKDIYGHPAVADFDDGSHILVGDFTISTLSRELVILTR